MPKSNSSNPPISDRFEVDIERLEKVIPRYEASGPRYTSYPTAPSWNDDFSVEDYQAALQRTAERNGDGFALYAHVPFCRSLCHFCACNRVITRNDELPKRYLETIAKEIKAVRQSMSSNPTTSQLHWGGGTPTHLTPGQIETLFRSMTDAFPLREGAEVSIEVDPRVTTQDQIDTLADCGFNRISMGVQDLDPKVQEAIHRIQPLQQTRFIAEAARKKGMESVNLDLIYGLPFQTVESFSHTLDQVLDISPDRIALYAYAHVAWKAKQQRSFDEKDLPEPDTRLRIMLMAIKRFVEAGYVYIGMDHFARPDDELCRARTERSLRRNFMGYTTQSGVDLLGFGPSAISELQDSYVQSTRELPDWESRVEKTGFATMRGHQLSDDDQKRRWIIANLFCHGELRSQDYEATFGEDFASGYADELARLRPMESDELITIEGNGSITLTSMGRLLVRNVAMTFDAYLAEQQKSSLPLFSKTI